MHKNPMKCNKTQSKWCINKHGASKIIDTFETYQDARKNKVKQNNNKVKDWKRETPLAEILFLPGNGARKIA
jgi:hypothetical protein